ncbi:hypothetical protein [Citrobacter freundii]|uniref:hypothetical protein n=1 Tax=Citrobacter freundii TaxID=546 RepID=UPI0015F14C80|nr:hypothetical protein [Citrobacter freundii]
MERLSTKMIRFAIPIRSFATKSPAQTNLTFFFTYSLAKKPAKKKADSAVSAAFIAREKVERSRIVIVLRSFLFHYGTKNNDNVP